MSGVVPEAPATFAARSAIEHRQPAVVATTNVVKRAFDLCVSLILIMVMFPFLILIALAVKLDSPGAILFRQPRHGLAGKTINISKFRTMRTDLTDLSGALQATPGDERVTRVGRFLRRTCLDELPQLWDVLVGRMSLVGPRPHPIGMEVNGVLFNELVHGSADRLRVRPGLTGLAQVYGNRGPIHDVDMARERVAYDNEYIDRWTFWLDIGILLRTFTLPFRKGCY